MSYIIPLFFVAALIAGYLSTRNYVPDSGKWVYIFGVICMMLIFIDGCSR